ncbi:MAG TPA: peptidyl-prolyl cis-trans isomerase [Rhizomicrobium sp.]
MRKYAKSWVASLFLGLLALSFGVWGIADIFRGSAEDSVASVAGQKIPIEVFQRDYRNATRDAVRQGTLSPAQARAAGQQVLNGLIDQTAIENSIHRYGITATDDVVSARVRSIPGFSGPLGTFDHNTFLRLIDQAGYSEQSFIDYVRGALIRDQFVSAASAGLALPSGYARELFNYLNEARAAEFIVLPSRVAGPAYPPTDAQLTTYVQAHRDRFSTPEYRKVTYAWLTPQDVSSQIKVTDDQLKQQYEAQKSQYIIPEKRTLEQITFPDLASAKAARSKIDAGTSFADLARQRRLNPSDISIGTLTQQDLGDRGAAVFGLPQNGVSQPLKAPIGYALIHVVSITPGTSKSFGDAKDELRKQVVTQQATANMGDIANRYIDESSRGESLRQAAAKVGMHVGQVDAIDSHGNVPGGTKAQVPPDPELLAQIFKAEVGEEGDPFTAKSGVTYVVKVEGVRPPALKPLDAVRAEATVEWQKKRQAQHLAAKAKELAAKASVQKTLSAVAAAVGAQVQTSGVLRRPGQNTPEKGPLPRALITKIFSVPAGEAVYGPNADGSSYIVARVTAVQHPPAMVLSGPMLQRFAAQIGQQAGEDIATAVVAAARANAGVTINQQAVNRVTGEGS